MKYDPNYCGDDSGDDEEESDEDEDYDEDLGGDDEDDDTSWKVRRAAVKVLSAAAGSRPEMLGLFYKGPGPEVASRFKEREANVRLDVLECATTLVRTTALSSGGNPEALAGLQGLLPVFMAQALKQLGGKDEKTKAAVFGLLRQVVAALPGGGLEPFMDKVVGCVASCLADKSNTLRLDALGFLRVALEAHPPSALQPHVAKLLPLVLQLVAEDW
jgi:cullin-associated NEDD8-dissociated protein 1